MDCRMNNILKDRYGNQDAVVVRNAGANVHSLKYTLKQAVADYDATELHILPHTDCGAMKAVVLKLKKNDERIDESICASLVDQFKNTGFENNTDLEKLNVGVQLNSAKSIFEDVKITSELVELKEEPPEDNHALLVLNPSKESDYSKIFKAAGADPRSSYVIQGSQEEVISDLKLAVRVLGMHDLRFVSLPGEDVRSSRLRMEKTRIALNEEEREHVKMTHFEVPGRTPEVKRHKVF